MQKTMYYNPQKASSFLLPLAAKLEAEHTSLVSSTYIEDCPDYAAKTLEVKFKAGEIDLLSIGVTANAAHWAGEFQVQGVLEYCVTYIHVPNYSGLEPYVRTEVRQMIRQAVGLHSYMSVFLDDDWETEYNPASHLINLGCVSMYCRYDLFINTFATIADWNYKGRAKPLTEEMETYFNELQDLQDELISFAKVVKTVKAGTTTESVMSSLRKKQARFFNRVCRINRLFLHEEENKITIKFDLEVRKLTLRIEQQWSLISNFNL